MRKRTRPSYVKKIYYSRGRENEDKDRIGINAFPFFFLCSVVFFQRKKKDNDESEDACGFAKFMETYIVKTYLVKTTKAYDITVERIAPHLIIFHGKNENFEHLLKFCHLC